MQGEIEQERQTERKARNGVERHRGEEKQTSVPNKTHILLTQTRKNHISPQI